MFKVKPQDYFHETQDFIWFLPEVFYYSATLTNINFLWHQLQYDCDTNCKTNQKSDLSAETKFLLKFSVFSLYQD